jgi:bile acid:Na+ symporter, BASS family
MPPALELTLTASLGLIMFSLGISLTVRDFQNVFEEKKAFLVGAIGQILMLPLIAFAIILAFQPTASIAIGLLILAASPGGATSAFMTGLLKGNVALSVSLTAVCSLLCVATMPLVLSALIPAISGGTATISVPVGQIIQSILLVVVGPVALGMALRVALPDVAGNAEKPVKILASALFVALLIGAIMSQLDLVRKFFAAAGLFTIVLNISTILCALALAFATRLNSRDGIAIVLECGLQNAPLAMFIAANVMKQPELSITAAIYGVLQAPITLGLGFLIHRLGYNRSPFSNISRLDLRD